MNGDPLACPGCRVYYQANRAELVEACAQLAPGCGATPGALLREYLAGLHDVGHDPARL